MLRSLFPFRSPSRSPSPVPTSSSDCSTSLGSSSNPSFTSTSRSPSPFPSSLSASLSKSLPPLPAPAPGPEGEGTKPKPKPQAKPKNKISTHRLHQLTTLLTILSQIKQSLQREQDLMVSILNAATTTTAPNSRTPSPDSQDIDLLALASNACRAKRYRAEEPTSLVGVSHWQGVVDELGRAIERLEAEVEGLERERRVLEESW